MINNGKAWRKTDEKMLKDRVNELLQSGAEIEDAFIKVAEEIGRTARGCKDRWNLIYKKRSAPRIVELKTHDYSELFHKFSRSYTDVEKTIGDLIQENDHLKQRVAELEKTEKAYTEARSYFMREKEVG